MRRCGAFSPVDVMWQMLVRIVVDCVAGMCEMSNIFLIVCTCAVWVCFELVEIRVFVVVVVCVL